MDRLSLFRLLADPSRYAIYQEIYQADRPLSTVEISDKLNLHPSTVRLHLDKLREADLVRPAADRHGTVGRPQYLWSVGEQLPALGAEPEAFRLLAHLLADLSARSGSRPSTALDTGRQSGMDRMAHRSAPERALSARVGREACVQAVLDELTDLGFDPSLCAGLVDGDTVAISFQRCPFRELAVRYPDLVCQLHRGITEGILAGMCALAPDLEAHVQSFSSLVDADPCRVGVSIGA
jgi:predicted ArsR family transcriptional regulator